MFIKKKKELEEDMEIKRKKLNSLVQAYKDLKSNQSKFEINENEFSIIY
jgi:uncharacterized protein YoxC